ncbi:MAG: DUF418 domain-containing protein [Actinomycetota bacterium]
MSPPPPELTSEASRTVPTLPGERITSLDAIRGVAVLGILPMNVVGFALVSEAYFNVDAGGSRTWFDELVGGFGEIFIDGKFMGIFSALFGAGIVLFADRAAAKDAHPVRLSLWRNLLLLLIGVAHTLWWDGDILVVYAVCSPVLLVLRSASPRLLAAVGMGLMLLPPLIAWPVQAAIPEDGPGPAEYWTPGGEQIDAVGIYLLVWLVARALGMMLIGIALYRWGVLQGERAPHLYRTMTRVGLAVGLPLAVAGFSVHATSGYAVDVAVIGDIPAVLAIVPMVIAYIGIIVRWNAGGDTAGRARIRSTGRMALSNYLSQSVLGVTFFAVLGSDDVGRGWLAVFVLVVWALQLWWSPLWLRHFRFGPVEWLWRVGTYRRMVPLRRS